ncbi:acyl-homoserine-lactone synthase [Sphingomonas koreensis]
MIQIFTGHPGLGVSNTLDDMHRDRKRVFVDLLKWEVPIVDAVFELDQFDNEHAIYLIEAGEHGKHLGSFRLLPTDRPHLLGSLFPQLCDEPVPTGSTIFEITRGCLSPQLRAAERQRLRNRLTSAAVDYALRRGMSHLTCVADSGWLGQVTRLGWDCRPLGVPRRIAGVMTGALEITLSARTVEMMRATGTYTEVALAHVDPLTDLAA